MMLMITMMMMMMRLYDSMWSELWLVY